MSPWIRLERLLGEHHQIVMGEHRETQSMVSDIDVALAEQVAELLNELETGLAGFSTEFAEERAAMKRFLQGALDDTATSLEARLTAALQGETESEGQASTSNGNEANGSNLDQPSDEAAAGSTQALAVGVIVVGALLLVAAAVIVAVLVTRRRDGKDEPTDLEAGSIGGTPIPTLRRHSSVVSRRFSGPTAAAARLSEPMYEYGTATEPVAATAGEDYAHGYAVADQTTVANDQPLYSQADSEIVGDSTAALYSLAAGADAHDLEAENDFMLDDTGKSLRVASLRRGTVGPAGIDGAALI